MRLCEVEGCERPYHAKGLCSRHWQQAYAVREDGPRCRADGCERAAISQGLCGAHRQRLRQSGSLGVQPLATFKYWTPEEDARIQAVLDRQPTGLPVEDGTWQDFALILGRTHGAVRRRAAVLRRRALA